MLSIYDIPLWDAKNKIKSDWGLRCVRIHEIVNCTYIKLSAIYKYMYLKWEQCSLTIIQCVYVSRQVDQNTAVPRVMHLFVPNDVYKKLYSLAECCHCHLLRNLHSGIPSADPCTVSHTQRNLPLPSWLLEGSATRDRSGSSRGVFSVWSSVITCKIKCDSWQAQDMLSHCMIRHPLKAGLCPLLVWLIKIFSTFFCMVLISCHSLLRAILWIITNPWRNDGSSRRNKKNVSIAYTHWHDLLELSCVILNSPLF